MKTYKIGYSTYEESDYTELAHANLFTKDEITELVAEAILEILKTREEDDYYSSYQDFHCGVVEWLIENKGFQPIKYDAIWDVFGWASIFVQEGWERDRDPELNKLMAIINEAGYGRKDDSYLNEWEK